MIIYVILNTTLNHHVTTQTDKAKAEAYLAELKQDMQDMEYKMTEVNVGETEQKSVIPVSMNGLNEWVEHLVAARLKQRTPQRQAIEQAEQEPVAWPHPAAKVVDCDMIGTPIIRAFWPLDIGTELYVSLPKCQQEPAAVVATTNEHQAIVSWRGKPLPHGAHLYTSPPQRQPLTDEVIKLRGEIGVLVGLLGAALQVIETVDGDDVVECQMLMELQNKITYAIRGASGIKGEA